MGAGSNRRAATIWQILFVVIVLGIWEGISRSGLVDPSLLPPFSDVAAILWLLLQDPGFLHDLGITAVEVMVAFVIAAPLAISTGFVLGEKLHLGEVINPFMHFVLAVPQSIFLPIFILLFGIGFLEKVVFGITHAYFVIVVTTVAAVRSVPHQQVLMARAFGATPSQIYTRIYLPAMLPLVVTGFRIGMIFCIIGVVLAEMYGSRQGVGRLLFHWGESFEILELLAGILVVSILTIAVNEAMRFWEIRAGRWQAASDRA